ncbi:hypothetical protein BATDEDRAFT_16402, partial [Batrachochytrium dendrobatidis JAM81]
MSSGNKNEAVACCTSIVGLLASLFFGKSNTNDQSTELQPQQPVVVQQPPATTWQKPPQHQYDQQLPSQPHYDQQVPVKPNHPVSVPHSPPSQQHHVDDAALIQEAESLRDQAHKMANDRAKFYDASQAAWNSGNKADAKEQSDKAKQYGAKVDQLNAQASALFFKAKNAGRGLGEIDLHGQFVREAVRLTDERILQCRQQANGQERVTDLVVIVGKGLHSVGGVAKIKPAIVELMQKHGISATMDTPNAGCITVHLE